MGIRDEPSSLWRACGRPYYRRVRMPESREVCEIGHSLLLALVLRWASKPWGGITMLAEIFMLRLEAVARTAKEAATTNSGSRFVPITLPAAKAS